MSSRILKTLDRGISVSKEDLESNYIVRGRTISEVIDLIGMEKPKIIDLSEPNPIGIVDPRPMHTVPPLSYIAQPLGLEIWVRFFDINGLPVYFIVEPPLDKFSEKFYLFLRQRVGESSVSKAHELLTLVKDTISDLGVDPRIALLDPSVRASVYYVFRDLLGYGPIEIPMEDVYVEEVSWFAHDFPLQVVDKKVSSLYPNAEFIITNMFFDKTLTDEEKKFFLTQIVRSVTSKARVGMTTARPLAEARIPDPATKGFHRLAAHLDIVSRSPAVTIRKFPQKKLSITELLRFGTLSPLEASYLIWQLVNRGFVLIVGGMASGKTTLLQALISALPAMYKVVTIEDTPELSTPAPNWHALYVRSAPKNSELEDVSFNRLVRHSLRHRGTIVTLGEVRGEEMADLIQAAASVSGDTRILIRDSEGVKFVPIGLLVDSVYGDNPDWTRVEVSGIEVLTYSDGEATFKPIKYVLRHWTRGIYRILHMDGSVRATGSHSVFVLDIDSLRVVPKMVKDLRKGDYLVSFVKRNPIKHDVPAKWDVRLRGMVKKLIPTIIIERLFERFNVKTPEHVSNTELISTSLAEYLINKYLPEGYWRDEYARRVLDIIRSDLDVVLVEDVIYEDYEGYVYDLSVPESEAFYGGDIPILLHNSGHGAICLPPETPVIAMIDGRRGMYTIKDVVESHVRGHDVFVLSLNTVNNSLEYKRVTNSIKVETEKWIKIVTESGKTLKMTPDHRVLVYNPIQEKIEVMLAKDLRIGDRIPVLSEVPSDRRRSKITCCGFVIKLTKDLGRIYGLVLFYGLGRRTYTIPREYKQVITELPLRITIRETKRSLYVSGKHFGELIDEISNSIIKDPLSIPQNFIEGFFEVTKGTTFNVDDTLAFAIHYMLKTIGVDSSVDSGSIYVIDKGEGKPYRLEEILSVEEIQAVRDEAYDIEVEDNHNFVTGASIVTSNCTFHARDPMSVLARITSKPINAAPESLKLITSIVHVSQAKTYARGRPELVRRIIRTFEIKDVKGNEVEAEVVFRWNPGKDIHYPTIKQLKTLWMKSKVLRIIGSTIYVDESPKVLVELYVMAKYLEYLVGRKVFDIKDVSFRMSSLYLRMDKDVQRLWEEKFKKEFADLPRE